MSYIFSAKSPVLTAHGDIWRTGVLAAIAAALVNGLTYFVARMTGAIPQSVLVAGPSGEKPIGIGTVVIASVIPVIFGAVFFTILTRTVRRPQFAFVVNGGIALAISLLMPLSIEGAPARIIVTLMLMHLVAEIVTLTAFGRLQTEGART